MKLSDFSSSGFLSFSRVIQISNLTEAKKLGKFLGDEEFVEGFNVNGPGKYFIFHDTSWGRQGDSKIVIQKFIPEIILSVADTLKQLKTLRKIEDIDNLPYVLFERLMDLSVPHGTLSYEEAKKTLTDKELKALDTANADLSHQHRCDTENFLAGFD